MRREAGEIRKWVTKFNNKKLCYTYLIFFVIALLLELTVFNYKFYMTLGNDSFYVDYLPDENLTEAVEVPSSADMTYTISSDDSYEGTAVLRFEDIDEEINSLRVDIGYQEEELPEESKGNESAIEAWYQSKKIVTYITAHDEANELGVNLGYREIVHDVERSTYMTVHLSGVSDWVELKMTLDAGRTLNVYGIEINPVIPFHFSFLRLFVLGLLLSLIYTLRPKSIVYKVKYNCKCKWQIAVTAMIVVIEIIICSRIAVLNPHLLYPTYAQSREYYDLAEAFHQKQFYLDIEVPEFLLEMDNPYDTNLRAQMRRESGSYFLWDYAYYDGHYYCYFGVVPEVLFYYPYYELFGEENEEGEFEGGELEHYKVVFFCAVMTIIAAFLIVRQLIRLWYPDTSFLLYIFLAVAFSMGCEVFTYLAHADSYLVPIVCGLMFSVWGIYFWLSAKKSHTPGDLTGWRLVLGALCMALVAGCRPQMLIMSFLVFPIFWSDIRSGNLFKGKNRIKVIGFCLPYIVVAAGLMYYNAARFGSPFDFGANYNLTTNDMTKRGFDLGRIGLGLFTYLFQPMKITADFPFVQQCDLTTRYLGATVYERPFGGVFMTGVLLLPLLLLPWIFKCFKERKQSFAFCLMSVIAAVIVVVADTEMAGILFRYYTDFSWMLYLAATIVLLAGYQYCDNCGDAFRMTLYRSFLVIAAVSSLAYQVCRIYVWYANDPYTSLSRANPVKFYEMAYRIAFWL